MQRWVLAALFSIVALGTLLWWWLRPTAPPAVERLDVTQALGGVPDAGFARATTPRAFRFPADHGPHPEFRNEWWYFTGNLTADGGRRFGYELSIFRIALSPVAAARASAWGTNQVYMAHLALTDAGARQFHFFERFARGAAGLAGAQAAPFAVWLEDWRVEADARDPRRWRIGATAKGVALELALAPTKPVVLQGERGLSRKSAEPGNASYYYSLPRLATEGTVTVAGVAHRVNGNSWLDREWSTSALGADQVGWDWFALQLNDGAELMLYQLRDRQGRADPFSAGVLIAPDGRTTRLARADFAIEVLERWRSPRGDAQGRASPGSRGSALEPRGGEYPARWRLSVPRAQLALEVTPVLADQELAVSVRYWEGAVDVRGTRAGRELTGVGYVELTGYAPSASRNDRRLPTR